MAETYFDFYIDQSTNDLAIKDGDFYFTSTEMEALRQRIMIVFRTWTYTWFYDDTFGVDYESILSGTVKGKQEIDAVIIARIHDELNADQSIKSYSSTWDGKTRSYTFSAILKTPYGDVTVDYTPSKDYTYPTTTESSTIRASCDDYDMYAETVAAVNELYYRLNYEMQDGGTADVSP